MAVRNNAINLSVTNNASGFDMAGGTAPTKITVTGSDVTLTGAGTATITFPSSDATLATLALSEELTNKTLTSAVGKGTWTASGTWTLPAHTLGGTVSGGGNQMNNVIIGTSTPLAGTFTTLAGSYATFSVTTTGVTATTTGANTTTAITAIIDSSSGAGFAFQAKNAANFAHGGNAADFRLVNASDTGSTVSMRNASSSASGGTSLELFNGNIQFDQKNIANLDSNKDNFAIGSGTFIRMQSDASRQVTGFTGGLDGRQIMIRNFGTNNIVFMISSGSSTAANQFLFSTGTNITVASNQSITLMYDVTTARWFDLN